MLHDYFKEHSLSDKVNYVYTLPIDRVHSLENIGRVGGAPV